MDDGIHTLAYGHKDITAKVVSIWQGPELFLMSADEAKSKGLHPSHQLDPNMVQPGAPKISFWKARSKTALDKAKKQILEGVAGEEHAATKVESDDSDDDIKIKPKSPLSVPTPTAHSPLQQEARERKPETSTFPLIPSQSTLDPPLPTFPDPSDIDPFDSDDSILSDDSMF